MRGRARDEQRQRNRHFLSGRTGKNGESPLHCDSFGSGFGSGFASFGLGFGFGSGFGFAFAFDGGFGSTFVAATLAFVGSGPGFAGSTFGLVAIAGFAGSSTTGFTGSTMGSEAGLLGC